jgi:hypothetical protein
MDKKVSFELETEVQSSHEVMFSANWFGGKVRSKANFNQSLDQPDNTFETKVLSGAYHVNGELKRQPPTQIPDQCGQSGCEEPKRSNIL